MNKTRLEAFSDGIFGFAATLLILGIALPEFKNTAPSDAEIAARTVASVAETSGVPHELCRHRHHVA
jgi:uncharacterized membrane protein